MKTADIFQNIAKLLYRHLKKIQLIYFTKTILFSHEYRNNRRAMKHATKSRKLIKQEMKFVKDYWKCKPLHYIRYGLYNRELSKDELLDYIPPYYLYNFYYPTIFTGVDTKKYSDKYSLFKIFTNNEIPTPNVIALYHNRALSNNLSITDLFQSLNNGEKLFFKPRYGQGGTGIIVIKNINGQYLLNNTPISSKQLEAILNKNNIDYVIQKGVVQRKDISDINSTSVNTLRAVTQLRNNIPNLSVCVMRIGRDGKDVDNSHQGGISVQVDVNTGEMNQYAHEEHGYDRTYESHPDSGFIFKGFKIKEWDNIKKSILDYAAKLKEVKEIAWDIAIVDEGILVIEINIGYGLDHLQCCCGGLRRILNIYPTNYNDEYRRIHKKSTASMA